LDEQPVVNLFQLQALLDEDRIGKGFTAQIIRASKTQKLSGTVGARP